MRRPPKRFLILLAACALAAIAAVRAADAGRPFSQSLSDEQKQRLGLGGLSSAQLTELDAAIAIYARGEATSAVEQAVKQSEHQAEEKVRQAEKKAADTAVADYRKKQEPGLIARTLDGFKRKQEEDKAERFTVHVVGEFRGWQGGTYFPLENGQVWRQVGSESNELPPAQNAEVEIFQSKNGYWRLKYNGAWITVKRLQ